jgi:putative transposase
VIGIEDLNMRGMMANRHLARAIADIGAYEFRRQLEYKASMHDSRVVVAGPWYPSSKLCSMCDAIYAELTLGEREWTCAECGVHHDRDRNAAVNLKAFAVSSTVTACGGTSTGLGAHRKVKPVPVKQEPSGINVHV